MEIKNIAGWITLATVVLVVALAFVFWENFAGTIGPLLDPETIKDFLETTGAWAPLIFIGLQALQVIIAPIPMQVFGIAGGYIFGAYLGTVYSLIGLTIGSFVAIWLSRMFGRKLVEYFVSTDVLDKFDHLAEKGGLLIFFLIFLMPALPDDAICFIAGLTNLSIPVLVLMAFLGRLPGLLALNLVGEQMRFNDPAVIILILLTVLVVFVAMAFIFKPQIERLFARKHRRKTAGAANPLPASESAKDEPDVS